MAVIDSSGTMSIEDFQATKRFVSQLASEFQFGQAAARFGVVTFSNDAEVSIKLGEFENAPSFEQAVSQIQYQGGQTNTAAAINSATQQFLQNGRPGVHHAMFIITDSPSNNLEETLQAAANARSQGIEVFVIAVGVFIDEVELYAIATDPDSQHLFLLRDFSSESFNNIIKPLAQRICGK